MPAASAPVAAGSCRSAVATSDVGGEAVDDRLRDGLFRANKCVYGRVFGVTTQTVIALKIVFYAELPVRVDAVGSFGRDFAFLELITTPVRLHVVKQLGWIGSISGIEADQNEPLKGGNTAPT